MRPFASAEELTRALGRRPEGRSTLLVGVDGCGASGKSTVAAWLSRRAGGCAVVHMDDFYVPYARVPGAPVGTHFDWRRLEREVLAPLADGRSSRYRVYDWSRDELGGWAEVSPGGCTVVEGVTTTRLELSSYYDLTIWVECPREVRLLRGLARDGEAAREQWELDWMPEEDRYVEAHHPEERAMFVVDGTAFLTA